MFDIQQTIGGLPYRVKKWSVGSTPVQIVPPDNQRAYVGVFNHTGSQMFIGFDGTVTGTEGPIGTNSFTLFEFVWMNHAILCTLPLWAAISGAPAVVWTIEVFWRPTGV